MGNMKAVKRHLMLFGQVGLVVAFALSLIASLHPDARTNIRGMVLKDHRTILSSAEADLNGDGSQFTIAKIQTRDSIALEIFRHSADGSMRLMEKIELPDAKDGYFSFSGHATNLAIEDIDGDGKAEILAPTFDRDLVGRLNIFRLNQDSQAFDRVIR